MNQPSPEVQQTRKRPNGSEDGDSGVEVDAPNVDLLAHIGSKLPQYNLTSLASEVWLSHRLHPRTTAQAAELQRAIQVLPSRTITDSLVQHFLRTVNHNYDAIYPPTFLENYTRWWNDRTARRPLSPEFTCLLIRALSNGVQYLGPAMKENLEFELAESASNLHETFHQSAEALSSTFTPGEKGITQVQQLFLVVTYLKGEGRFIDSWHAMAACVREAQEQGLHLDDRSMKITEYEREMRRRMWTIIYVWDWLMSKWLGRPLLADHDSCTFQLPTLQLELDLDEPDLPSPFTHMKLQVDLIRRITPALKAADIDPSEENVKQLQRILDEWSAELPPVWRMSNPDTKWDAAHPNIPWQRELLNGTMAMIELLPARPYLTGSATAADPQTHERLLKMGADAGVLLIAIFTRAYQYISQFDPKHFYINFIFFDVTTVMCSAIIHDTNHKLPQREDVLQAISDGLDNLRILRKFSKPGATSYAFVAQLAQRLPLSQSERGRWSFGSNKRTKADPSPSSSQGSYEPQNYDGLYVSGSDPSPASSALNKQSVSTVDSQPVEDWRVPGFEDFEGTDFGGIEELWDWQGLNLDLMTPGIMTEQPGSLHLPLA